VSNVQLAKEVKRKVEVYRSKSIAEQNTLDITWDVLMSDRLQDLHPCIFPNKILKYGLDRSVVQEWINI
jgi:hypothetical protein